MDIEEPQGEIEIKLIKTAPLDALVSLYKDAGWWKDSYGDSPEFLNKIVADSALFAGAFVNKKMIVLNMGICWEKNLRKFLYYKRGILSIAFRVMLSI